MNEFISILAERIKKEDTIPQNIQVMYDPLDYALPEPILNAKRVIEHINAQEVYIDDYNCFTGMFRLIMNNADVPGDIFKRDTHHWFEKACKNFYGKYIENLVTFEWQHSSPNYEYILKNGLRGSLEKIKKYKKVYIDDKEKLEFLNGMEIICEGIVDWSHKCADVYKIETETQTDTKRKVLLLEIASNCKNVPENPATSFFEGLQSVLFCFYCLPDSIGTLDRYMLDLYNKDITSGKITREQAKYYLQEFFIHLSNYTPFNSYQSDKGGECHFAIGGYTENGEDGFNDLSRLIVEALMEIDAYNIINN